MPLQLLPGPGGYSYEKPTSFILPTSFLTSPPLRGSFNVTVPAAAPGKYHISFLSRVQPGYSQSNSFNAVVELGCGFYAVVETRGRSHFGEATIQLFDAETKGPCSLGKWRAQRAGGGGAPAAPPTTDVTSSGVPGGVRLVKAERSGLEARCEEHGVSLTLTMHGRRASGYVALDATTEEPVALMDYLRIKLAP